MKTIKMAIGALAVGAMAFGAAGVALAGSQEPPGWTAGLALGGALPEGLYFIDTASTGGWRGVDDSKSNLVINVPLLAWSTPWTIAGGRVEVLAALPAISGGVPNPVPLGGAPIPFSWSGRDYTELYNPVGYIGAAWDLGHGFGFSAFVGGWAAVANQLALFGYDSWVLSERVNLSYVADGWKLAANLSFGQPGPSGATTVFNSLGYVENQILPSYFNYDLTATKTIGKWEAGLVGFGSTDTSRAAWTTWANQVLGKGVWGEQSQFALGGLVGYSFPGITVQTYVTHDVYSSSYLNWTDAFPSKSYETRIWTRAIIPIWNPPAPEPYK